MNTTAIKYSSALIFVFFLCSYYILSSGHFYVDDENSRFALTRALLDTRDIAVDRNYHYFAGKDGRFYCKYPPAPSVLAVPLYAAARALPHGADAGSSGVFFVSAFNQIVTALVCAFFFLAAVSLGASARAALAATLLFGFASPALPYSRTFFGEPLAALGLLASFYFIQPAGKDRNSPRPIASGFFFSLAILSHFQAVLLAPPFLFYLWHRPASAAAVASTADKLKRLAAFCAPCAAAGALILLYNFARYGGPLNFGYEEHFSTPLRKGLYGFILSPGKSVFIYCPLILAAILSFSNFHRKKPSEARLFALCFLIYLFLHAKWSLWGGDLSWGPRYLVPVLPLLLLPVFKLFGDEKKTKFTAAALGLLFAVSLAVQFLAVSVDYKQYYYLLLMEERPPIERNELVNFNFNYAPVTGHSRMLAILVRKTFGGDRGGSKFFNPKRKKDIREYMRDKLYFDFRISNAGDKSRLEKLILYASYALAAAGAAAAAFILRKSVVENKRE